MSINRELLYHYYTERREWLIEQYPILCSPTWYKLIVHGYRITEFVTEADYNGFIKGQPGVEVDTIEEAIVLIDKYHESLHPLYQKKVIK